MFLLLVLEFIVFAKLFIVEKIVMIFLSGDKLEARFICVYLVSLLSAIKMYNPLMDVTCNMNNLKNI